VVESSCGSQCLVLAQVYDLNFRELLARVLDEVAENTFLVISNYANLLDIWDLRNGGKAVPDNRVTSDFEQGLWRVLTLAAGMNSCRSLPLVDLGTKV
jgi:hypothetical protein